MSYLFSGLPSIVSQAPAVNSAAADAADREKKQGIMSMFKGLGEGPEESNRRLRMPQQQAFDVQGLLASLFGA